MAELESKVQARIIKRYKSEGWLVVKVILCNMAGFPDLMCLKEGKVVFIEVKKKGGKPRPLQTFVHNQLKSYGFDVLVLDQ